MNIISLPWISFTGSVILGDSKNFIDFYQSTQEIEIKNKRKRKLQVTY